MPSTKTVWGIDVGQCALKALRLQWRDNKLRVLGFDVIEHAKILSQPDADEQALIRGALGKFVSRNSLKGSLLVISVPGQASFTRFIKLPPVEMRKIPEIVRYEARQQIPFNLEDVVWDYQTISPASAGPREVEVGIFAMKRDIVNDYVSDFLAMRIEPDIVQMAPIALYNFLRHEKAGATGATLLMDVGAENTNLVIADAERVWIRNVQIGGNNFTQALARELKLPFSKAESLKRHAAESKHARQVFQAMRPVFSDLVTEVQRSIGYYTSLHRDSRVERVLALGNAFRLQGLAKFISQNLGIDVHKIESIASIASAEALTAPLFRENVLSFGVAFGLAIQGLGIGAIQTSLLPPEILNAKILKRKRPFFVAAGAAVVAAVGCFAFNQVKATSELSGRPDAATLSSDVARLQDENGKQQKLFDEQKAAMTQQQAKMVELQGLVAYESYAYDLMDSLWKIWPYDPNWARYDPRTNTPPRSSLNVIEMLTVTTHYVADAREYTEAALAGGTTGAAPPPPPPPPPPPGQTPEGGPPPPKVGPEPAILIRITGITPKTGRDGQEFLNSGLIAQLRKDPRTCHVATPSGEEVLAKVRRIDVFKNSPDHAEFTPRAVATAPGAPPPVGRIDKSNDFWFEALWVVQLPEDVKPQETAAAPPPVGAAAPAPAPGNPTP
jgi:type IV pilus assembly protein PilM